MRPRALTARSTSTRGRAQGDCRRDARGEEIELVGPGFRGMGSSVSGTSKWTRAVVGSAEIAEPGPTPSRPAPSSRAPSSRTSCSAVRPGSARPGSPRASSRTAAPSRARAWPSRSRAPRRFSAETAIWPTTRRAARAGPSSGLRPDRLRVGRQPLPERRRIVVDDVVDARRPGDRRDGRRRRVGDVDEGEDPGPLADDRVAPPEDVGVGAARRVEEGAGAVEVAVAQSHALDPLRLDGRPLEPGRAGPRVRGRAFGRRAARRTRPSPSRPRARS